MLRWHDGRVRQIDGRTATADELAALALSNYGHFTSMRVERMRVRGLGLHLRRLSHDCRVVFGTDLDTGRVRHLVRQAAAAAGDPVVVRVTVVNPKLELGRPAAASQPRILVTTRPAPAGDPSPSALATRRYQRDLPEIKHVGLFATLHHRREAQLDGHDDALFAGPDGHISEAATANIGFVRDGTVVWPDAPCLPGVTMRLARDLLRRRGVVSTVAPIGAGEVGRFHSAFLTNAAVGIRPVAAIDGAALAVDDPLVAAIREAYTALPGEPV